MFSIVLNYRKYIHMKRFFQIKELETRSNNDLSLKGFFCYFIFPVFFFFLRLSNGLEKKNYLIWHSTPLKIRRHDIT